MQVVLLERIENLGKMGDVVKVRDGFARNFLLPKKKALRATKANIARFEKERAALEAKNAERKGIAEGIAKTLDGQSYVVLRQAGESGQLYGSVNARNIADTLKTAGFTVSAGEIMLPQPIKAIGLHKVFVSLHPEVKVTITLNVARSPDEAERQARGENVLAEPREEAETPALEELLEDTEAAARLRGETGTDKAPAKS